MIAIFLTIFSFLFLITLVVAVHEYGHYLVARFWGVDVQQFSIGFGPSLWSQTGKNGMTFRINLLPFGGFVKLLDKPNPRKKKSAAFNKQSVFRRITILLGGPIANFLLAIFLYWIVGMVGITHIKPIIGAIIPHSIAEKAGLQKNQLIIKVEDKQINSWPQFYLGLVNHGEKSKVTLSVTEATKTNLSLPIQLDLSEWQINKLNFDVLTALGIEPYMPKVPLTVAKVTSNSPAKQGGIKKGDEVIALNGEPLQDWQQLLNKVQKKPGERVNLLIKRAKDNHEISIVVGAQQNTQGTLQGYLGIQSTPVIWPKWALHLERYSPKQATLFALKKTGQMIKFNLTLLMKIVSGHISMKVFSGPIGIAQWAGHALTVGWLPFITCIALINISLGIFNLLPIPLLDGGQIVLCLVESLRGKPLSPQAEAMGARIGLALLLALMTIALWNDFLRL